MFEQNIPQEALTTTTSIPATGQITQKPLRDSVRQAFRGGITRNQIIRFLKMHAHPVQQDAHEKISVPVIPPTVVDQIALWEEERNRFTFTEGVLYNQFLSHSDYDTVRNYAESINVSTWSNKRKLCWLRTNLFQ